MIFFIYKLWVNTVPVDLCSFILQSPGSYCTLGSFSVSLANLAPTVFFKGTEFMKLGDLLL